MKEFLTNNMGTIIVLVIVACAVAGIIAKMVKDKKSGKHICGGDCSNCHGCSHGE